MYSAIVVGTDGSDTARKAVSHAAELAKAFGATLHLVTGFTLGSGVTLAALDPQGMALAAAGVTQEAATAAVDEIEAMLRREASAVAANGVKVETHAIPGDPAEVLLNVAETHGAELIVVGNRGMTGAKRFLLGSVPNKVSHHSGCDVLIVHTC